MTLQELCKKVKEKKLKDSSKEDKKKLLKPVYQELSSGNPSD